MPHAIVERQGRSVVVTLNRPERYNAMTPAMLVRMYDAVVDACADDDVRTIVLTGAGGNFSSGADLRAMAGDTGDAEADSEVGAEARFAADPSLMFKTLLRDYRPTKPVIAAVEGAAIAGGLELLLGTDIRVAGATARFGVSEVRWSIYPMAGSPVRLPRQIPSAVAAELLLTGKHITATEAGRIGLVGQVVPEGEALTTALELAEVVNANGPLAVEAIVRTLHETDGMSEAEAFAHDRDYGAAVFASEDAQEGARSFAERRPAVFRRR
jgi:enoyl-CoA hydratase